MVTLAIREPDIAITLPHRCEKKCSSMKACGRHQCRRRCCDGDCPPCDLPCGRRLRCGNHKCPAPCHSGPCLPCPLTSAVACACGRTCYTLPCGSEGKAVPPHCRELCPVPGTCRHADTQPVHRSVCFQLCALKASDSLHWCMYRDGVRVTLCYSSSGGQYFAVPYNLVDLCQS